MWSDCNIQLIIEETGTVIILKDGKIVHTGHYDWFEELPFDVIDELNTLIFLEEG